MLVKRGKTNLYGFGVLLLTILGIVMVLLRQTNYGVGLMVDSLTHTSTAESLLKGEGLFTAWNSRPQQGQPPLYALVLTLVAALDIGDVPIIEYAGYVGAVTFGLTVLASMAWISLRTKSRGLTIIAGGVLAISPFLGDLFSFALTETVFLLLIVLALMLLDQFVYSNQRSTLILAAVFSALVWLTRHIGITVIVSSLLVLVTRDESTFRQKVSNIAIYSAISILPSSLWMVRNYIVLGQFTERYWSTGLNWVTSINLASSEFTKWLIGTTGLNFLSRLSGMLGIDIAVARVAFLGFTTAFWGLGLAYLYQRGMRIRIRGLIVLILFILCYSGALVASLILTDVNVEMRYLAPIYVPAVVVVFIILGHCLTYTPRTMRSVGSLSCQPTGAEKNRLQNIIIVGLSLHLALAIFSSYGQIMLWREQGFGYSSKSWIDSETIRYLKSSPIDGRIYSNEARAAYIYTDGSDETETHFIQLQEELPDEARYWDDMARHRNLKMYVVWFYGWRPFIQTQYDFMQLISLHNLDVVAVLEDGIVLRSPYNLDKNAHLVDSKRAESLVLEAILDGAKLVARSEFDVYLADARLIYITSCSDANTELPFFLHVFPMDIADIFNHRTAFNNHDFRFSREGFSFGGQCAIIRDLPSYDIEMIRTGQFSVDEVKLWEESFSPS